MSGLINIDVKLPSYVDKNNIATAKLERVCNQILDETSEKVYMNVMDSGIGVAGGTTPTKGSPVYQKPKSLSQPPAGTLLRSHYLDKAERHTHYIKGGAYDGDEFYINDVINGTSKFAANPYHKRAVDKAQKEQVIANAFRNAINRELK